MNPLHQSTAEPDVLAQTVHADIREGDWSAYQRHSMHGRSNDFINSDDKLTAYRRQCALAYLGKRAQFHGGAYSEMRARTFTPRFLFELGDINRKQRFSRYPWLGKLADLIVEIEREQERVNLSGNVISLIVAAK
jgi:hypothetical protein